MRSRAAAALPEADDALGKRLRESERAILIWSAEEGSGGAHLAALAGQLGFDDKPGSGAFHLPSTPNGRGVADAWAACCDDEAETRRRSGCCSSPATRPPPTRTCARSPSAPSA